MNLVSMYKLSKTVIIGLGCGLVPDKQQGKLKKSHDLSQGNGIP